MTLRVVHCGTGNVGGGALRGILHHPEPLDIRRYHSRNARRG